MTSPENDLLALDNSGFRASAFKEKMFPVVVCRRLRDAPEPGGENTAIIKATTYPVHAGRHARSRPTGQDSVYAGDAGGALGSALELYFRLTKKNCSRMTHAYYGSEYTTQETSNILNKFSFSKNVQI